MPVPEPMPFYNALACISKELTLAERKFNKSIESNEAEHGPWNAYMLYGSAARYTQNGSLLFSVIAKSSSRPILV